MISFARYLLATVLSVLRFTATDYPMISLALYLLALCCLSYDLQLLITQ